jgi:hypothetical protein
MPEKDTIYKGKIKQTGVFDFKDFYSFTYDWLMSENYDVTEKSYSEKVSGESKDVDINWEASKKVSDYFKFVIKLEWKILGMKKTKVKKGDREVSMDTGQVEIKFSAVLVKDYEGRWETNAFSKFLRGVYDRYIVRQRINEYEGKLIGELNEIVDQCKSFLAIEAKH